MSDKKCFVFISTLEHIPWGGCEDLWFKTAMHALKERHFVYVVVFRHNEIPKHLSELSEKGAVLLFLDKVSGNHSLKKRVVNKLSPGLAYRKFFEKFSKEISKYDKVIILISQAGGFDFAYGYLDKMREWLLRQKNKFHVVVQNVPDLGFTLSSEAASKQQQIFANAVSVGFVSKRNKISAERILASNIRNASQINNPLNFKESPKYIGFPKIAGTVHFAVVAALRCFHKGQDILFQVLSGAEWLKRDWALNLYGKGPDEAYLRKLAQFYRIDHKVFFHGHTHNINEVWEKNHIHILPSLGEGTPLALIESMACGRGAITTDVGGNAEYVCNDLNGFVADYPTFPALKKVMELGWENQHRWEEMGRQAYEKIMNDYDLNAADTLYRKMLNNLNEQRK